MQFTCRHGADQHPRTDATKRTDNGACDVTGGANRPAGVILAGGAGRRIGGRKALVPLGGRPLISHVIDRIGPQVCGLGLNAEAEPDLDAFGLPTVPDILPASGPLGGILTAMDWARSLGAARVLTVAVDTPFLPADLVERLMATDAPAAYAVTDRRPPRDHGDLVRRMRDGLQETRRQRRSKGPRLDRGSIGAMPVMFEDADAFLNINTPETCGWRKCEAGEMTRFDTVIVADWSARATPSPARPSKDAIFLGICRDGYVATLYQRTRSRRCAASPA
jgi:molybdopterin-guanine dinucleotide biosynthesis protein A